MKVVVLGGAGFIGSAISKELAKKYHVISVDKKELSDQNIGVSFLQRDILQDPLTSLSPVFLINATGRFSFSAKWEELYKDNVETTKVACELALRWRSKKFIHISSTGVYGFPKTLPYPEEGPRNPRNLYEKSKKVAEDVVFWYIKNKNLPAIILRTTLVVGDGLNYGVSDFIEFLYFLSSHKISLISFLKLKDIYTQLIDVNDVARAVKFLLETDNDSIIGEVFNLSASPIKISEFFKLIETHLSVHFLPIIPFWIAKILLSSVNIGIKLLPKKFKVYPLAQEWLDYLKQDHIYDTRKLERLGYSTLTAPLKSLERFICKKAGSASAVF